MTDQTPAQIAYQAYGAATGGLIHDGRPMPTWDQLGNRIQHAWAAAALALGMERTIPRPTYSGAWAELTGYVQEAIEDGGTIAPAALATYMRELRHKALAGVREWMTRTANPDVVASKPTDQPADLLNAAAQRIREGRHPISALHIAWPIAEWLDDAAEGDDQGEHNPYALAVARAVLGQDGGQK